MHKEQPRIELHKLDEVDKYKHIVSFEDRDAGYNMGKKILAKCGKYWTPKINTNGLALCPKCKFIALVLNIEVID